MFKQFSSLANLVTALPDEKACIEHFRAIRWPNGIVCPHCGTIGGHYTLKDETHKCGAKECHKKFSVRNGTIFEESRIPLKKWFIAIYLATSHKKGISSCQLARDIEVTQKTAWFVLHRINEAASSEQFNEPLEGVVELARDQRVRVRQVRCALLRVLERPVGRTSRSTSGCCKEASRI